MPVSELIKGALPEATLHHDAATMNTPTKAAATQPAFVAGGGSALMRGKTQQQVTNTVVANGANNDNINANKDKIMPKTTEGFYKDLQQFHERRGTPIAHMPKISGRTIDLYALYNEVTERGGFHKVNNRDEWDEVLPIVSLRDKCVNACAVVKQIYRRYLEKYERLTFFGEDPDKMEALEAADAHESGRSRSSRFPSTHGFSSSGVNAVPMAYNYRQHVVNMERRRTFRLSTNLHKHSSYEKLMLSLISPLPNEQDFAINICSLMASDTKNTLKLVEYPKLLDVLLAHCGVFSDYTLRNLFQHVYVNVRKHSLYAFWRELLHEKPQILDLYTDEQALQAAKLIDDQNEPAINEKSTLMDDCLYSDFLNLWREHGTQSYVGQRVQQIVAILRNLSFLDENIAIFAKNRTLLRFIIMSCNVRWGNIHIQCLDIAGNIAGELELCDTSTDEVSRNLMLLLCEGIEGSDRAVIINSLEVLYKLCQKDSNEDYINKCLNLKFYETLCLFLSLNDIMLLIFTLETIYALTSMGARPCHLLMQVRGVIDQLISLITVEAQAYGPDGCILMRVVETVPGNMLPMVAQNIANLQNVAVIQQQKIQTQAQTTAVAPTVQTLPAPLPTQPHIITATTPIVQPTLASNNNNTTDTNSQQKTQTYVPNNSNDNNNSNNAQEQAQPPAQVAQQPMPNQQQTPSLPAETPSAATVTTTTGSNQFTHDDEQYALGWLVATFERAAGIESRIEQQELYRMYLTNCQKCGKQSVVNHMQFPRLVRTVFGNNVGPAIVRRVDGTEYTGIHYVAIKLRAQALPVQVKTTAVTQATTVTSTATTIWQNKSLELKKLKKKPTQDQDKTDMQMSNAVPSSVAAVIGSSISTTTAVLTTSTTTTPTSMAGKPNITASAQIATTIQSTKMQIQLQQTNQQTQPTTSLIKSLLANKVTQRQQKQKDLTIPNAVQTITQTNVISANQAQQQPTPIKVTSNAISALVNNPLMQNTPVKVGQTTIKPLNPQMTLEKKHTALMKETSAPPPLAPLSGNNVVKDSSGRSVIIANQMLVEILDKKVGDNQSTIIKRKLDEGTLQETCGPTIKRLAYDANSSVIAVVNANSSNNNIMAGREETKQVTPSKNAANLYAEMAASILEDEDLEDIPTLLTHTTSNRAVTPPPATAATTTQVQQSKLSLEEPTTAQQSILIPTKMQQGVGQRQLLFKTNTPNQQQLKLNTSNVQPTAMATIKTDQGLQTVPVILQQKTMDQSQPQLVLQQQQPSHTTQYVLATNHQGHTYLVAQQTPTVPAPPPTSSTQTVLVTQRPQQQPSGTKTIIILQQQTLPVSQSGGAMQQFTSSAGQKMIMTTPQGQSVLVTQRAAPSPATTPTPPPSSPIIINPGTSNLAGPLVQRQLLQTTNTTQQQTANTSGQISPTLLSQLNHIPATIKLHQPSVLSSSGPCATTATITRVGKPLTIVQQPQQQTNLTSALPSPTTMQIPQLQQHSSIIQQHIISGPSEKRQVILTGGGRAIEIKETVIAQTTSPLTSIAQSALLNSQTIITHLPRTHLETGLQAQPHAASIQQKPANNSGNSNIQKISLPVDVHSSAIASTTSLPTNNVLLQKPKTAAQATQVIVTQSSLAKKPAVITRPVVQTCVIKNPPMASGPPPLALHNAHTQADAQKQQLQCQTQPAQQVQQCQQPAVAQLPKAEELQKMPAITTCTPTAQTPPATPTTTTAVTSAVVSSVSASPPPCTVDVNWLYVCDWRNCPRRKFKSLNDLQQHACSAHCPEHLDPAAEIFCQWGPGPGLCDGIPRKRYSLMTHLIDRHITIDALRQSLQKRLNSGTNNIQPTQPPVTIIRNMSDAQRGNSSSPALSTTSGGSIATTGSSALQAIKRHSTDFMNSKELLDENEGPVTKSIRLTAALILRNLVTYTNTAKRTLRRYEPHLANIALSNVESSGTVSHILFELNN